MQENKQKQLTKRVDSSVSNKIQVLRGLAIIAVVFAHNIPGGMYQVVIRPFLNFCVGTFLFLSGMLSNAGKWNPRKRISKVLIPYALWTLIYVVFSAYETPAQIPVIYLKRLILGNSAVIMYYVFVYCQFALLLPLMDRLTRSRYRYWGFVIAPAEIILMRLIPLVAGIELNDYVSAVRGLSCLGWFTYYYLGYLLGNGLMEINIPSRKLLLLWGASLVLQMAEGYWYYSMGEANCGTILKLSGLVSGTLFSMLSYQFIYSDLECNVKVLKKLGDYSFGIYFSHLAVMAVLEKIPFHAGLVPYPVNGLIALAATAACVCLGRKILGANAKYLAF